MDKLLIAASLLVLSGCTITRLAQVDEVDTNTGIVRLTYNQPILLSTRTDDYVTRATAIRQCQHTGYATAVAFGQPVTVCSLFSGSLCLNETITLQYQCRGIAVIPTISINNK